jgi:hypothetical protein
MLRPDHDRDPQLCAEDCHVRPARPVSSRCLYDIQLAQVEGEIEAPARAPQLIARAPMPTTSSALHV